MADSVTLRVMGLCLRSGSVNRGLLFDPCVRGAMLTDLVFAHRLWDTPDEVAVDTTPTGFAPTDRLLDDIVRDPDQTLEWWLRRGRVTARDVAEDLVRTGRWARLPRSLARPRARYTDTWDPTGSRREAEAHRLHDAIVGAMRGDDCDAQTAAVAYLACLAGLLTPPREPAFDPERLVVPTGAAAWLVRYVGGYISAAAADLAASGSGGGG